MQKKLIILFITFGFMLHAQSHFNYKNDFKTILAKTKDVNSKLNYDKLLSRFKKNDSTLSNAEVLALLIGFTAKPAYKPYEDMKEERNIYNLNAEGKYEEAHIRAGQFLKTHPLSVRTLFEISFSSFKAGRSDSAKFYVEQGQRIFKAMTYSGDGKTNKTPMFALGPLDGQDYIYKFIGASIGDVRTGSDPDGNALDIQEVKFKAGPTYELFFVIQHAIAKKLEGNIKSNGEEQDKKSKK